MIRFYRAVTSGSLVFGLIFFGATANAQTYDLAANWADNVNPSANGVWQYGSMNTSHVFTKFTASANDTLTGSFGTAQFRWDGGFPLTLFKLAPGQTTPSLDGGGPGQVGSHTSNDPNTFLAIQWTAPAAGVVNVSGDVWMYRNIGRTNTVSLFLNGVATFSDVIIPSQPGTNSSSPFLLSTAANSPSDLTHIAVLPGDTVTLALRKTAASPFGDETGIAYHIVLAGTPEPGSLALGGGLLVSGVALLRRRRSRRAPH